MNPDQSCSSEQWSILTSAASISQLAAVLGGFLITAITLLLDRSSREVIHTIALFSSALLILILDSFLLGVVTGAVIPGDGDRSGSCAVVWTQGAIAVGMLAAGTAATFGGGGWMLAGYAVRKAADAEPAELGAYSYLAALGGWLTFAAAMAMALVAADMTIDYLQFMYAERPALWPVVVIAGSAAVMIAIFVAVVHRRTSALRRSLLDVEHPTMLALRSIKIATVTTTVLAIAGTLLTLILASFPEDWLTTPNLAVVLVVLVLTYVAPMVVSLAICDSVASPDERTAAS